MRTPLMVLLTVSTAQLGCDTREPVVATSAGISLAVGALHMPDIDAACYDLRVRNALGVVWAQGDPQLTADMGDARTICSDAFGNGGSGDIAFVGACDASDEADVHERAGVQNEVTVWVDGLYSVGDEGYLAIATSWQNPCGRAGCSVAFDCRENEDTPVALDFTILRQGNTGFFDIVVEFDDIFCSAKVDCRYANETPESSDDPVIHLVRDVDGGDKLPTVVFALACSAGAGDEGTTRLYLSDIAIDCAGEADDVTIPVGAKDHVFVTDPPGIVAQAVVGHGEENLIDEDKMYWTVAIGLSATDDGNELAPQFEARGCRLAVSGTASAGDINDVLAGPNVSYPYIAADVHLTSDNGDLACSQHPVNGGNGVDTVYSGLDGLPAEIVWEMVQAPEGRVIVAPYVRAQPE